MELEHQLSYVHQWLPQLSSFCSKYLVIFGILQYIPIHTDRFLNFIYCTRSLLSFLSLLVSIFIWLPVGDLSHGIVPDDYKGMMQPQSVESAVNEMNTRNRISVVCKILSFSFMVQFSISSDIGKIVQTNILSALQREEVNLVLAKCLLMFAPICLELIGNYCQCMCKYSRFHRFFQVDVCYPL